MLIYKELQVGKNYQKITLLVDMDEVLTDFIGAACQLHGHTREEMEAKRRDRKWDICEPLGVTVEQFWKPINNCGVNFWEQLPKLPWTDGLLDFLDYQPHDWYIITAPGYCPTSYLGKLRWIRREIGTTFQNFFITPHKHMLANANRILIDDREDNISKFDQHGGRGIIFPSTGNSLYNLASDPVPYVRQQLQEIYTELS